MARRPKTKRGLMAEAIRRDCDPVIFSLGFRNPRRGDAYRWGGTTRRNIYLRWRGTTYDEIEIQWDHLSRPWCRLNFQTSQVLQPPRGELHAVRSITRGNLRSRRLWGGWIGPWRSPTGVAALVNRRVLQLEAYLLRGESGWWISVCPPIRASLDEADDGLRNEWLVEALREEWVFGDPWLDPESDPPRARERRD